MPSKGLPKVSKRRDVLARLKEIGAIDGVRRGTKHDLLAKGNLKVAFPRESRPDIDDKKLGMILRQLGVSKNRYLGAD